MTDRTRPPWADLPHGDAIREFLDELRNLTPAEARAMEIAWDAGWDAALTAALAAARASTGSSTRGAAWCTVWGSAWGAVSGAAMRAGRIAARDAAGASVQAAVRDAARALVVADLVGQYGLTRGHLDTLTAPARTVPRLAKIIDRALGAR